MPVTGGAGGMAVITAAARHDGPGTARSLSLSAAVASSLRLATLPAIGKSDSDAGAGHGVKLLNPSRLEVTVTSDRLCLRYYDGSSERRPGPW